jgi:hypothetical protein
VAGAGWAILDLLMMIKSVCMVAAWPGWQPAYWADWLTQLGTACWAVTNSSIDACAGLRVQMYKPSQPRQLNAEGFFHS